MRSSASSIPTDRRTRSSGMSSAFRSGRFLSQKDMVATGSARLSTPPSDGAILKSLSQKPYQKLPAFGWIVASDRLRLVSPIPTRVAN